MKLKIILSVSAFIGAVICLAAIVDILRVYSWAFLPWDFFLCLAGALLCLAVPLLIIRKKKS